MRKICLLFVLTFVSVFSASAQTSDKSAENINSVENIKVKAESDETKIDSVKTIVKTPETDVSKEQKPQAAEEQKPAVTETEKKPETSETVKKPEAAQEQKLQVVEAEKKPEAPVLAAKKTLGMLSTGNSAIDGYIEEFCELYNVDPLLIFAQMNQESGFKGRATSSKGASGFMQLMPDTARRFGVTNIYNPKQNIKAGVKYMRWLLDKFGGDMRLALAGYNAGEGSVIKYGNKIPPYRETQNYVERIMSHYELITNPNTTLAENVGQSDK